jgi:HEAT repeat protein
MGVLAYPQDKKAEREAERARQKEIDDQIKELSKKLQGDGSDRRSAISSLASIKSAKVIPLIGKYLTTDEDTTRIAAAEALATIDHPDAATALVQAVGPNLKSATALRALIAAMAKIDWELCADGLHQILRKASDPNIGAVAKEAIEACAKIGSPASVDELIKIVDLADLNGAGGGLPGGAIRGPNGQVVPGSSTGGNRQLTQLRAPAIKALSDMTGQNFPTTKDVKDYWSKNKSRMAYAAVQVMWCEKDWKRWDKSQADTKAKCPYSEKTCSSDRPCKRRMR